MTIQTRSLFYYIEPVILENRFLDFSEGGPNIAGELNVGAYSPEGLLDQVEAVLNDLGTQVYTATFNRVTNKVTIAGDTSNFELNVTTGPNSGQSIFEVLGFTSDKSGAMSYEGDEIFANVFRPQFWLQDYVPPSRWKEAVKANINESADGTIETFSFGKRSFYEFNIKFTTDIDQGVGGPIETQAGAVASLESFMDAIIDKGNFELMEDVNDPDTYVTILLEKAPGNSMGVGFRLKELTGEGMAGYFETGKLKLRLVE